MGAFRSIGRRRCDWALLIAALAFALSASAREPSASRSASAPAEARPTSDPAEPESGGDGSDPEREASDPNREAPDSEREASDSEREVSDSDRKASDSKREAAASEEIPIAGGAASQPNYRAALADADRWQALRVLDLDELANFTPSFEIDTDFAWSNPNIFMRGIGSQYHGANAPGPVGVYQDGVNLNAPAIQLGQAFDLEAVEALRGPQGSLYAHNASAGALLLRSARPDGTFGVQTSLSYGNYDYKKIEAAIDVPLIEDRLSMRVSGTAQWRDGYTKNQCAGWDPTKIVNPATGEPYRRVDEGSNRTLYYDLQPAGQYTFDPGSGQYELGPVMVERESGAGRTTDFVYLNRDLAYEEVSTNQVIGVSAPRNNGWVLAEDLRDENGAVVATAGTQVARMSGTLFFAPQTLDNICITVEPGKIATLEGQYSNPDFPERWSEGAWQKNATQPGLEDFAGLERWTNDVDHWAARMLLLYEPLDELEWMINAHGSQNRGDSAHLQMLGATASKESLGFFEARQSGFTEQDADFRAGGVLGEGSRKVEGIVEDPLSSPGTGGGNPYSGFYSSDGLNRLDAWGINGHGRWDLGAAVVTLLYDYEWYDRVVDDEGDANPRIVFPSIRSDSAWQTTEELRLEGDGDRYRWTAGFFFLYEELDANNLSPATQNFEIERKIEQQLTSFAPYASGAIELVEPGAIRGLYALTLGGGLRYHHEEQEFSLKTSARPAFFPDIETQVLYEADRKVTSHEWTGDAQLSYTPFANEQGTLLTYAKYARGVSSGQFNARLQITGGQDIGQQIDPVDPGSNDAVEFGLRSRWLGDRITLDAAVFRYWYHDLQVFDIVNEAGALPTQQLFDRDAKVLGAEVELRTRLASLLGETIGNWSLLFPSLVAGTLGWLDTEFEDFTVTKSVADRRGFHEVEFNYGGNPLVAAPEWNFALFAEYVIPLFGWGALVPRYDVNYRSKVYFDPQKLDPLSQDGYWLHNARIAYRTRGERIELAFWVANLLDEEYKLDAFDLSRDYNTILERWGEPRMYGVTLSLNW